jgi:hypothetical protein
VAQWQMQRLTLINYLKECFYLQILLLIYCSDRCKMAHILGKTKRSSLFWVNTSQEDKSLKRLPCGLYLQDTETIKPQMTFRFNHCNCKKKSRFWNLSSIYTRDSVVHFNQGTLNGEPWLTQFLQKTKNNGSAHFWKCKQLFEYQYLLVLARHLVFKVLIYI